MSSTSIFTYGKTERRKFCWARRLLASEMASGLPTSSQARRSSQLPYFLISFISLSSLFVTSLQLLSNALGQLPLSSLPDMSLPYPVYFYLIFFIFGLFFASIIAPILNIPLVIRILLELYMISLSIHPE